MLLSGTYSEANMATVIGGDLERRELPVVALLFAVVAVTFGFILFRSPLMYGIDGPYYLIQVKSILDTGTMSYVDPTFCFYFFALLSAVIGDPTAAIKLGTILFCALTVIPAYLTGKRLTSSKPAAVASVVVCSLSAGLIALGGEFVKNAVGSFFLLSLVYLCLRILKGDDTKATKVAAAAAFGLTALTHILDLGLAVLFLILLSTASFAMNVNRKGFLAFSLPLLGGSVLIGAAAYFAYSGYTIDIGKGFSFVNDFLESLANYDTNFRMILGQGLPQYLSIGAGVVSLVLLWRKGRVSDAILVGCSTTVLLLLNLPFVPRDWAWRFTLMSFVPMSHVLAALIGLIGEKDIQWGITALLALLFLVTQTLPGSEKVGPTITPQGYNDLVQMSQYVPPHSRVASRVGDRYWVEYVLDSQAIKPPSPGEQLSNPVYFILGREDPLPPPSSVLLYRGVTLSLYVVPPRVRL